MLRHQRISILLVVLFAILHVSYPYHIRQLQAEPVEDTDTNDQDDDTSEEDITRNIEAVSPAWSVIQVTETSQSTMESGDMLNRETPIPPEDSMGIYSTESDKICLAVKLEGIFQLTSPESRSISVPDKPEFTGHCGPHSSPVITINLNRLNLTLRINKSDDGNEWAITVFQLEYNPEELFKNKEYHSSKNIVLNAKPEDLKPFTASMNQSISCNEMTLELFDKDDEKKADVGLSVLRVQAFNVPSKFGPYDNKCPVSTEATQSPRPKRKHQSDVAPIAVGSVLAILTLLLLAGYAVHRSMHSKKPDYSTME